MGTPFWKWLGRLFKHSLAQNPALWQFLVRIGKAGNRQDDILMATKGNHVSTLEDQFRKEG